MITEFMVWELTILSLLTGMLIGIAGSVVAVKVMARIAVLEEKAKKYDKIEQDLVDAATSTQEGDEKKNANN